MPDLVHAQNMHFKAKLILKKLQQFLEFILEICLLYPANELRSVE